MAEHPISNLEAWNFASKLKLGDKFKAKWRSVDDDPAEASCEGTCVVIRPADLAKEGFEKYALVTCTGYDEPVDFPQDGENLTLDLMYTHLKVTKRAMVMPASPSKDPRAQPKVGERKREEAPLPAQLPVVAPVSQLKKSRQGSAKEMEDDDADFLKDLQLEPDDDEESEGEETEPREDGLSGKQMTDPFAWRLFRRRDQVLETLSYLKVRFEDNEIFKSERYVFQDISLAVYDFLWCVFAEPSIAQNPRFISGVRRLMARLYLQEQLKGGASRSQVEALRTAFRDKENADYIQRGIDAAKANLKFEVATRGAAAENPHNRKKRGKDKKFEHKGHEPKN